MNIRPLVGNEQKYAYPLSSRESSVTSTKKLEQNRIKFCELNSLDRW